MCRPIVSINMKLTEYAFSLNVMFDYNEKDQRAASPEERDEYEEEIVPFNLSGRRQNHSRRIVPSLHRAAGFLLVQKFLVNPSIICWV